MKWALAEDYEVFFAEDRQTALEILTQKRPAVVMLDLGLPPHPQGVQEGFRTLSDILHENPAAKVIVVTGHEEREQALQAIGQGAYDFFRKPFQIEELKVVVRRAIHVYQLEREYHELQRQIVEDSFEGMLGTSPQIQEVFSTIRKLATTDVAVLIVGENGTGKEMLARGIHRQSARRGGPFIAINCSAIPETLLESELFGHEKGAFTGAHVQRKGRIEGAQGGTLFLDEIGELPLPLQSKLLRFLQEHKLERIGGREDITIDVRVIAATNSDLGEAIKEGRFREDLYYRLGVLTISLPPLRDREGDILLLATELLRRYTAEGKTKITGFSQPALLALETHYWPGNIRELENRIKRAAIMAERSKITPEDLELTSPYVKYAGEGLKESREALESDFIRRALARNKGNLTKAATDLKISRSALYELIEKLEIERE